ncbi:hypothetical protein ACC676_01180 [Rhizobium ruizarguesonis]
MTNEDDDDDQNPLNSDELGNKGEHTFQALCSDAKLICNKADRDRSGWDFIVEFNLDHKNPGYLDTRSSPISCVVQQKTMWDTNDRIKLRLSSIERLAKDRRASFIYVLKVSKETLEPTSAHLIEMRGDTLAKVLKKLREEHAAKRFQVNRATLYLTAGSEGRKIGTDGESFKQALLGAIGPTVATYEAAKHEELRTLGQEGGKINLTFDANSKNELADVFLGIIPVKVRDVKASSTRFGITLEKDDIPDEGEVKIQLERADTCLLTIRRDRFAEPAVFNGEIFFAPSQTTDDLAARIVTDGFEIVIRGSNFSFQSQTMKPDTPLLSPTEWRNYFLMADALVHKDATIEIRPGTAAIGTIRHRVSGNVNGAPRDFVLQGLTASGMLTTVIKHIGVADEPKISLSDLLSQVEEIGSVHTLLTGEELLTPLGFEVEGDLPAHVGDQIKAVHANYVLLASQIIVWVVDADMKRETSDGRSRFVSTRLDLRELTILPAERYETYIKDLADGSTMIMSRLLEVERHARPT